MVIWLVSTSQITISNVCWSSQNSTLDQPAMTNSMHSQSQYTLTPRLPKYILYFKQLAEDLRNILASLGQARKSWTQPTSSFPWFTSKTKWWILDWYLILNSCIATLLTFHFPGAIVPKLHTHLEAVAQSCSVKKVFLEILQNPQENASLCSGVFL